MEEFTEAQQNQERRQGELKDYPVCLDNAFAEVNEANRNLEDEGERIAETSAEFQEANRNLEDAGKGSTETKRKADDAHDRIKTHRDRCRRATKELGTFEEDLNDSLGRMEQLKEDTAAATHTLSCSIPDRDYNEVRYLQETLDMIEDFQRRGSRWDAAGITLVPRQK